MNKYHHCLTSHRYLKATLRHLVSCHFYMSQCLCSDVPGYFTVWLFIEDAPLAVCYVLIIQEHISSRSQNNGNYSKNKKQIKNINGQISCCWSFFYKNSLRLCSTEPYLERKPWCTVLYMRATSLNHKSLVVNGVRGEKRGSKFRRYKNKISVRRKRGHLSNPEWRGYELILIEPHCHLWVFK